MQSLTPAATSPSVVTEVIRVRGLTFSYPKSPEPAVRGMDFSVGRGEIFGFLGPSGAGKSTTQKLLIGLLRGHGGEAAVWGKDPLAWGPDYYQRIGVSCCTTARRWIRWSCWTPSAWPATPTCELASTPRECRCA